MQSTSHTDPSGEKSPSRDSNPDQENFGEEIVHSLASNANYNVDDPFAFLHETFDPDDDDEGVICEITRYESRYNAKGDRVSLHVGRDNETTIYKDATYVSAIVFTKYYKQDTSLDFTEIAIRSPYMRKALREIVREYPGLSLDAPVVYIRDQPRCIFHYRKELDSYCRALSNEQERKHVKFMLQFMCQLLKTEMIIFFHHMEAPVIPESLNFAHLWMAFIPGELVYVKVDEIETVLRLKSMSESPRKCSVHRTQNWSLVCSYIDYDGEDFGICQRYLTIFNFENYKRLDSLNCFPLRYHPKKDEITIRMLVRGKNFLQLHGVHHRMYEGPVEALSPFRNNGIFGEEDEFPLQSIIMKSRVIIDAKTFRNSKPTHGVYLDSAEITFKPNSKEFSKLSEAEIMICNAKVAGFALASRRWCFFRVENFRNIEYNKEAFEKLLLPPGQKELIHSLVKVHADKRLSFDDIIKGKGKGISFLLHGRPGTGKTLTAESVADYTEKPLYIVSCGDLGADVKSIEEHLSVVIQLATVWNAVVLIDEADVFLEQRSSTDLMRNSLVSVFLRVLEYYEGILILTTNRVHIFDEAFKSRIHLTINYPDLVFNSRRDLWRTFIERGSEGSDLEWLNDVCLNNLASYEFNGRQIKNAVRTAHALSVSAETNLSMARIETVLEIMGLTGNDLGKSDQGNAENREDHSRKRRRLSQ